AEGPGGASRSIHPQDGAEVQQPQAKPIAGSPEPSSTGMQREATEKPGAAVRPWGAPSVPAGKGALLRQGAVSSREDTGVPAGAKSPAMALEKGGSQPEPLSPGENRDTERVSPRSRSMETAPGAAGKAGRAVGREAELCSGETQAGSSIKIEICPWEEGGDERWGPGRALGKGISEGDPGHPREELGTEKPRAKTPELLQGAVEKAESVEGRRAEVCPWETGEGERTLRAEICPWDAEGAQHQQEKQEGEQRQLPKRDKTIRPNSRGSPCPGEGEEQPSTGLAAKLPALPTASPQQGGTLDSKKADICPWEVGHVPLAKTEICPWEEPATPLGKERVSQETCGTSKGENKRG
ncbi:GP179 protein, partial [Glaucidium brasilianum]|nr:GP179 protein [Glaucidium brasilianum]